jgi:hypothetical protein
MPECSPRHGSSDEEMLRQRTIEETGIASSA